MTYRVSLRCVSVGESATTNDITCTFSVHGLHTSIFFDVSVGIFFIDRLMAVHANHAVIDLWPVFEDARRRSERASGLIEVHWPKMLQNTLGLLR